MFSIHCRVYAAWGHGVDIRPGRDLEDGGVGTALCVFRVQKVSAVWLPSSAPSRYRSRRKVVVKPAFSD